MQYTDVTFISLLFSALKKYWIKPTPSEKTKESMTVKNPSQLSTPYFMPNVKFLAISIKYKDSKLGLYNPEKYIVPFIIQMPALR